MQGIVMHTICTHGNKAAVSVLTSAKQGVAVKSRHICAFAGSISTPNFGLHCWVLSVPISPISAPHPNEAKLYAGSVDLHHCIACCTVKASRHCFSCSAIVIPSDESSGVSPCTMAAKPGARTIKVSMVEPRGSAIFIQCSVVSLIGATASKTFRSSEIQETSCSTAAQG